MEKLSETLIRKRAFYVTADFWKEQAAGNLVADKWEWKRWRELKVYCNGCAFCRYYKCEECVLDEKNSNLYYNACAHGNFHRWLMSHDEQVRISAAKEIWKHIEAYMKSEYPEYFTKVGKWK